MAFDPATRNRLRRFVNDAQRVDAPAYLRDIPRLIIEHNIYGMDIDPRAAQIAALALWLRAQRTWHDAGVKAKDRPLLGHGHVVAATAPPAARELRQQFAAGLDYAPPNTPKDDPLAWALNDEEKQVWEAMLDFRKHHPLAFASLKTSGEDGADAVRQALMEENRELWRRLRLLRDAMRLTDWLLLHYNYPEMKDWFDD